LLASQQMSEPQRSRIRVLLVSGWAGAGKDTVAAACTGYRRVAFADPLKRHAAGLAGLQESVFHDRTVKDRTLPRRCPYYPTARTPRDILLQHAAAARAEDPDVYAREIAEEIRANPNIRGWVISDWRYRREYEFLSSALPSRDYQLVRVRVVRPGVTPSDDETEHDLDSERMDHIVQNDGDRGTLAAMVAVNLLRGG
jgi:hypothetical protein